MARFSTGGVLLDPMGLALSTAPNSQYAPALASDGTNVVVAWEDSALCRMVRPWLSALSRDSVEFGRTAAQELTALLDGGPARTVRVLADPLLWELVRKLVVHKKLRDEVAKLAASYRDPIEE